jgi:hypothetical protein
MTIPNTVQFTGIGLRLAHLAEMAATRPPAGWLEVQPCHRWIAILLRAVELYFGAVLLFLEEEGRKHDQALKDPPPANATIDLARGDHWKLTLAVAGVTIATIAAADVPVAR